MKRIAIVSMLLGSIALSISPPASALVAKRVCTVAGTLDASFLILGNPEPAGYQFSLNLLGVCTGKLGQPIPVQVSAGNFPTCGTPVLSADYDHLPRFLVSVRSLNPLAPHTYVQAWTFGSIAPGAYAIEISYAEFVPSCIVAGVGSRYGSGRLVRGIPADRPDGGSSAPAAVSFTFTP